MASKLELSLEDIVKANKKGGNKRGGGKTGGRGGARGGGNNQKAGGAKRGGVKRLNSRSPMKGRPSFGSGAKPAPTPSGPTRLVVSNLDFGVNDQDIQELFSRCGRIRKAAVHYDSNGRSQGTAEILFGGFSEANAAVKEYNGRLLDGRAMKVEIVGASAKSQSLSQRVGAKQGGSGGTRGGRPQQRQSGPRKSFGSSPRGGRGGKRGGRGGGRGGQRQQMSKDDLDKQMDDYRMQTDTA